MPGTDNDKVAHGSDFDPRQAAVLLDDTRRRARREFGLRPPWITAGMGAVTLVGYGALWLSTRSQHPYRGPSPGAVGLVYAGVAVAIAASVKIYRRATAGVAGASARQRQTEGVAILIAFLGSPVIQGAMKHYGASNTIVYGVIPAAAPLIIVGTTVVGIATSKSDWPQAVAAVTVVIGGMVDIFVGPAAAWLAAGISLFAAVVGYAVTRARLDRM